MKANIQTALITGASLGIGKSYCQHLAQQNIHLVMVARNQEKLDELATKLHSRYGITVHTYAQDLSQPGAAAALFHFTQKNHIKIDLLINNAGFGDASEFLGTTPEEQHAMLQCMINAVVELTALYLPPMLSQHQGAIINVGSIAGIIAFNLKGRAVRMLYRPIKAFVVAFSEQLNQAYRNQGIYCQCLCPGLTVTEFHQRMGESKLYTSTPKWFWMSADQVVASSLKAMNKKKRRVMIIPGWPNKIAIFLTRISYLFS